MASSPSEVIADTSDFYRDSVKGKEWNRQQQQAYTAWCNNRLQTANIQIDSLEDAFRDGHVLLKLFEAITGAPAPRPDPGRLRLHKINNVAKALAFMKARGGPTVAASAEEIVDGNVKMIIGMLWALILHFDIKDIAVKGRSAKEALLLWCQLRTECYTDVRVDGFSESFNDGVALCSIIHSYRPDLIDMDNVSKNSAQENLELAMCISETCFGLPHILDVRDFLSGKPDEKCVMTLVSALYRYFLRKPKRKVASEDDSTDSEAGKEAQLTRTGSHSSSNSESTSSEEATANEIIVDMQLEAPPADYADDDDDDDDDDDEAKKKTADNDESKEINGYLNEAFEITDDESVVTVREINERDRTAVIADKELQETLFVDCDLSNVREDNHQRNSADGQRVSYSAFDGSDPAYDRSRATPAPPGESNDSESEPDDSNCCCDSLCARCCCWPQLRAFFVRQK